MRRHFVIVTVAMLMGFSAFAQSLELTVDSESIVKKTIKISFGLSTTISFPDPVTQAVLGDRTLFSCELFTSRIVCSARGRAGQKTNLQIFTAKKDYDLTLLATHEASPSYVIFKYSSAVGYQNAKPGESDSIADAVLAGFRVVTIKKEKSQNSLQISVSQALRLGRRVYFVFSVKNEGARPATISDIDLMIVTRGGMTGLPVSKTKLHGTFFKMERTTVSPGQTVQGVFVSQFLEISDLQEVNLVFYPGSEGSVPLVIENIRT